MDGVCSVFFAVGKCFLLPFQFGCFVDTNHLDFQGFGDAFSSIIRHAIAELCVTPAVVGRGEAETTQFREAVGLVFGDWATTGEGDGAHASIRELGDCVGEGLIELVLASANAVVECRQPETAGA